MKFSKNNQPAHRGGGSRPSEATIARRQAEAKEAKSADEQAYAVFEQASEGFFNGFSMVESFHRYHDKATALEVLTSDDSAEVVTSSGATIHAGADDITVYVMTNEAKAGNVKKVVRFNRSVYVF